MSVRLERSNTNRIIAGVCGGLGEYLEIDATLVRVFFVVFALFGLGIIVYIALILLMPLPGRAAPFGPTASGIAPDGGASTETGASPTTSPSDVTDRRRTTVGAFLVAIGVIFLLGNFGVFRFLDFRYVWPLVVIGFGVLLLVQRTRR